jgi:mycothiol synthase
VSSSDGVKVRRVGFRDGTDEELKALHAVEVPVSTELRHFRMPQPIDEFMSYARNLPSQFDAHAWLAEESGTPVGIGYCWSNAAGDARVMECDVMIRQDRRREGIGTRLLTEICATTAKEGRSLLTWATAATVPAGEAFSRSLEARPARVNRTSEVSLANIDWSMIEEWVKAPRARERGYYLEMIQGAFPPELRADAALLHHILQTAPRDDLEVGDVLIDAEDVAEFDAALLKSGQTRWTLLVRDVSGACVGGTEVTFEPWEPDLVHQQSTAIDPAHRGLGLAKWAKGAMLQRIRVDHPESQLIRTGNAFSNAPMLAINDALGFKVIGTKTEWQVELSELRALSGP